MCLRVTFGTKCEDEHRMSQKQEVHTGQKATVPLLPDRQHRGWCFPRLPVPMMQGHWTELRWLSCPSLKSSNVSKLLPQTTEEDVQRHGQTCKQFTEDWLLRVPWTARRSNQSIIKEIGPGCSLEGMMLKLKLQYLGHLIRRVDFDGEGLGAGGEGDNRGWDGWMAISDSMDVSLSERRKLVMDREAWRAAIHGVTKSRTRLSDWTELK